MIRGVEDQLCFMIQRLQAEQSLTFNVYVSAPLRSRLHLPNHVGHCSYTLGSRCLFTDLVDELKRK